MRRRLYDVASRALSSASSEMLSLIQPPPLHSLGRCVCASSARAPSAARPQQSHRHACGWIRQANATNRVKPGPHQIWHTCFWAEGPPTRRPAREGEGRRTRGQGAISRGGWRSPPPPSSSSSPPRLAASSAPLLFSNPRNLSSRSPTQTSSCSGGRKRVRRSGSSSCPSCAAAPPPTRRASPSLPAAGARIAQSTWTTF